MLFLTHQVCLIDTPLQIGDTMERDSMFIGADKVLIREIAHDLIHALA